MTTAAASPPTVAHTLASGTTLASKYGKWGIAGRRMVPPPDRCFGFIVGKPNSGKTNLFAYNESALILNLDLSSTPVPFAEAPPPTAQFYPGINTDGQCIDEFDRPMVLTWDHIEKIKERLIEAATKNLPRPRVVVLDSVGSALRLGKDFLVTKAGKADWNQLHGEAAWETLYNMLLNFAGALRPYYGVWYIGHLTDKYVEGDNGKDKKVSVLTTPPGFLPRFYPLFEAALVAETRLVMETTTVEKKTIIAGKEQTFKDDVTRPVKKVVLTGEGEALAGTIKNRIALPVTLELPPVNGWATFEKAWREVAKMPEPDAVAA